VGFRKAQVTFSNKKKKKRKKKMKRGRDVAIIRA
jgi:hypothetical protein